MTIYRFNLNRAIKRQSLATAAVKTTGFPRLKRGSQRHQFNPIGLPFLEQFLHTSGYETSIDPRLVAFSKCVAPSHQRYLLASVLVNS